MNKVEKWITRKGNSNCNENKKLRNYIILFGKTLEIMTWRLFYTNPPLKKNKKKQKKCKENNTKKANQIINGTEFLPVASETRRQVDEAWKASSILQSWQNTIFLW